jgi:cell division protease FtsH
VLELGRHSVERVQPAATAAGCPFAGNVQRYDVTNRWLSSLRLSLRERRRERVARGGPRLGRTTRLLLGLLVVLVLAIAGCFVYLLPTHPGTELTIDRVLQLSRARQIADAQVRDQDSLITGHYVDAATATHPVAFHAQYPRNDAVAGQLITTLAAGGASVRVDPQTDKGVVQVVLTVLLPLMLLADLFALFLAGGRGGGGQLGAVTMFGQLRHGKVRGGDQFAATFGDAAGVDEAVAELREVVDYLREPARYRQVGAVAPKGILMVGPPGCGKTLLARGVAGEAGVPFFRVSGAEFVEALVGVGAARVRDLFARVRAVAPAILFIDELDAAGRRRGGGSGGGGEERDQTLNQLLVEMDGFDASSGVVVIAATNRPDILDPALLRPGRFDRHVTVDRPDVDRRQAILRLHAQGRPMAPIDLAQVARQTAGFSGADLAGVINEAALLSLRDGRSTIGLADVNEAVQRVLSGPQRRGHLMSEEERRRVAAHEAGHCVVAAALCESVPHRLSITARGVALGTSSVERGDDAVLLTEEQLRQRLAVVMAGRAAEELLMGSASTGAEHDLETATRLARDIAGRYGLVADVGAIRVLAANGDFLGGELGVTGVSQATHERFDAAVVELVGSAQACARDVLTRERERLERVVARVLEDETVEGAALTALLER